jgi:alanine dehydrogenase
MVVGLVKEIKNQESRVGLTPGCVSAYTTAGHKVLVEAHAGEDSGFTDQEYQKAGAEIIPQAQKVWESSQMIVKVKGNVLKLLN